MEMKMTYDRLYGRVKDDNIGRDSFTSTYMTGDATSDSFL